MISLGTTHDTRIVRSSRRAWIGFILLGLAIYGLVYAAAERIVYAHGERNRLFMIATAPRENYDFVILGASHAMPLGFEEMNQRLEAALDAKIINLSIEGGGLVPARFVLDYFLALHRTKAVVYVLDSFALESRKWNEERIDDPKLLKRAPFDLALLKTMWAYPSMRDLLPGYVSGFYKINDPDRFEPDVSDMEATEFHRAYRGNAYLDRERMLYLHPGPRDEKIFEHYLAGFEDFATFLDSRGIRLIVIKPPVPKRVIEAVAGEADFDARIHEILDRHRSQFRDFSEIGNQDAYFFDTDHLNRDGIVNFIDNSLADFLRKSGN